MIESLLELFSFPFMVNALIAGTAVAVLTGVAGWFVVLRGESFAAHTLAVIGFPGAAGAALIGVPPLLGYFAVTGLGALAIAGRVGDSERRITESAVIGTLQACALALGYLFVTLAHRSLSAMQSLLFGSFLGISEEQALWSVVITVAVLACFAVIGRPLLFTSTDGEVARARGVPIRALSLAFILVVGIAVAEASQITGSLLVFALIVMPPATARALTARPGLGIAVSAALGLLVTWGGLVAAYYSNYPVGFTVTTLAFALLVGAQATSRFRAAR